MGCIISVIGALIGAIRAPDTTAELSVEDKTAAAAAMTAVVQQGLVDNMRDQLGSKTPEILTALANGSGRAGWAATLRLWTRKPHGHCARCHRNLTWVDDPCDCLSGTTACLRFASPMLPTRKALNPLVRAELHGLIDRLGVSVPSLASGTTVSWRVMELRSADGVWADLHVAIAWEAARSGVAYKAIE
jgi:hypothetical protein